MTSPFPCPYCGHLVLDDMPSSFEDWDAPERAPWPEDSSLLCW
ncbi:hypothetical protein ACIBUR_33630 [Streptomyces anulatus]